VFSLGYSPALRVPLALQSVIERRFGHPVTHGAKDIPDLKSVSLKI